MTPDDALLDALDDALMAQGQVLEPWEVADVLDAVCALSPAAWALLEARWRARQEVAA